MPGGSVCWLTLHIKHMVRRVAHFGKLPGICHAGAATCRGHAACGVDALDVGDGCQLACAAGGLGGQQQPGNAPAEAAAARMPCWARVLHRHAPRRHAAAIAGQCSRHVSINKFHADLKSRGVAVGKDTLHSYLAHLEDALLLFSVGVATDSERRRQVNPRKVYPVDAGFIALYDRSGKSNVGHALETVVLLELLRRGAEVHYVRTPGGFEVDFYAHDGVGREMLIQVCAELENPDTLAREVRALKDAAPAWPGAALMVITLNPLTIASAPNGIQIHLASDWLLQTAAI